MKFTAKMMLDLINEDAYIDLRFFPDGERILSVHEFCIETDIASDNAYVYLNKFEMDGLITIISEKDIEWIVIPE
jgi:hypothetical protein